MVDRDMVFVQSKPKKGRLWIVTGLISLLLVLFTPRFAPAAWSNSSLSFSEFPSILARSRSTSAVLSDSIESDSAEPQESLRTDDVRFDNYSLILKGQRVFL